MRWYLKYAARISMSLIATWEKLQRQTVLTRAYRTQLYVEAEARMDTYEVEGQKRTSLNLLQRMPGICMCSNGRRHANNV